MQFLGIPFACIHDAKSYQQICTRKYKVVGAVNISATTVKETLKNGRAFNRTVLFHQCFQFNFFISSGTSPLRRLCEAVGWGDIVEMLNGT